jgi:hypothetical protein
VGGEVYEEIALERPRLLSLAPGDDERCRIGDLP